jgi:peptide chain release factor subunit 1
MINQAYDLLRTFADYAGTHEHEDYLSLYLLVDPAHSENQSDNPAWKIYLKNAITDIEAGLDPVQLRQWKRVRLSDTSPETAWARTRKRLEKYLTSYTPGGKTLVLFISPSDEYQIELPVELNNTYYYGKPHIQEFLWALDEYQQHLVLLFAEDQTRALTLALGETTGDLAVTSDDAWLRQQHKAAHAQDIQWRQDELSRRYVKSVAGQVNKYFLQNPDIERLVLGGNVEMANAVLGSLHPSAREKVIAVLPIPITTPPHEVAERIRDDAQKAEREFELELVNEIIRSAGAGGRGATGRTAVNRAMDRSAVRLLALPYPAGDEVEPLLLQAVQNGVTVEFVKGEAADRVRKAGGIVAGLYYAVN